MYKITGMLLVLFLGCLSVEGWANEVAGEVFHASFDNGTANAESVGGTIEGAIEGGKNVNFIEGVHGKAISLPEDGYLSYKIEEDVFLKDGATVCMWIRPHWDPGESVSRKGPIVFMAAWWEGSKMKNGIFFQHNPQTQHIVLVISDDEGNITQTGLRIRDIWKPNEWHHITGTWDAKECAFFLDGNPVSNRVVEHGIPSVLPKEFIVGKNGLDADIDELYIFNRPLSEEEIRQISGLSTVVRERKAKKEKVKKPYASVEANVWVDGSKLLSINGVDRITRRIFGFYAPPGRMEGDALGQMKRINATCYRIVDHTFSMSYYEDPLRPGRIAPGWFEKGLPEDILYTPEAEVNTDEAKTKGMWRYIQRTAEAFPDGEIVYTPGLVKAFMTTMPEEKGKFLAYCNAKAGYSIPRYFDEYLKLQVEILKFVRKNLSAEVWDNIQYIEPKNEPNYRVHGWTSPEIEKEAENTIIPYRPYISGGSEAAGKYIEFHNMSYKTYKEHFPDKEIAGPCIDGQLAARDFWLWDTWWEPFIEGCRDSIDLFSLHYYSDRSESGVQCLTYNRFTTYLDLIANHSEIKLKKRLPVLITEWGTELPGNIKAELDYPEEQVDFQKFRAKWAAKMLFSMVNNPDKVHSAHYFAFNISENPYNRAWDLLQRMNPYGHWEPYSVYWVFNCFKNIKGKIVETESSHDDIQVFATRDGKKMSTVVFNNSPYKAKANVMVTAPKESYFQRIDGDTLNGIVAYSFLKELGERRLEIIGNGYGNKKTVHIDDRSKLKIDLEFTPYQIYSINTVLNREPDDKYDEIIHKDQYFSDRVVVDMKDIEDKAFHVEMPDGGLHWGKYRLKIGYYQPEGEYRDFDVMLNTNAVKIPVSQLQDEKFGHVLVPIDKKYLRKNNTIEVKRPTRVNDKAKIAYIAVVAEGG